MFNIIVSDKQIKHVICAHLKPKIGHLLLGDRMVIVADRYLLFLKLDSNGVVK